MLIDIVLFLGIGIVAGTLAGLLGLGGGIIVVPALFFVFLWHNFPYETIAQSAVSTSLATMILTSISSFLTHYRFGYVDFVIFKKLIPGLFFGVVFGALIAITISTNVLKSFFSIFLLTIAIQMFLKKTSEFQHNSNYIQSQDLKLKWSFMWSGMFGALSSLLGVGAGSTFVPYLHFNKVQFNRAIGTASAITCVTAISATSCYQLLSSINVVSNAKSTSVNLIYWPAVFSIAVTSIFFAFFGARISHNLEASKLKRIFSLVLIVISVSLFLAK